MSRSATTDLLEELHSVLADDLISRIKSGEASASDLTNAIRFLKDNGIEAAPVENGKVANLARELKEAFEDEDNVTHLHF